MSIPTLSEICCTTMISAPQLRTIEALLSLYSKLASGNPAFATVREHAVKLLKERYPMLLDKYGHDELALVFSPEDLEMFDADLRASMEIKKRFSSLKGTILEPTKPTEQIKAGEDGFYPLKALQQGVCWPAEVDPTKREQFLSPTEFLTVFKMSKEEFNSKDKFVRMRLKKEHLLFWGCSNSACISLLKQ